MLHMQRIGTDSATKTKGKSIWKIEVRHGSKKKRLTVDSIDPLMDLLSGSSSPT
jgi:hypothetical protein